jgi:hypothetical protein
VSDLISSSGQNLYALKVLKAHGLSLNALSDICRATLVAKLTYASPAWIGYTTTMERNRLQAVLSKARRWGVYLSSAPEFEDIVDKADQILFKKTLANRCHVLHQLLPPVKTHAHNLRTRAHNRVLPTKTTATARNFLSRMLYKNIC